MTTATATMIAEVVVDAVNARVIGTDMMIEARAATGPRLVSDLAKSPP